MREIYGVPYKGGKNKIVKKLMGFVPSAPLFYDLFCGGCAVTHCAVKEKRFERVFANDLDGDGLRLFLNAVKGKYHNEKRWISREDFFANKNTDPYISLCWSFGNNQRDYLYGRDIEPLKKAGHYAVIFNDFTLLDNIFPEFTKSIKEKMCGIEDLSQRHFFFARSFEIWKRSFSIRGGYTSGEALFFIQRLQHLERLSVLTRLENLERNTMLGRISCNPPITPSFLDYRQVKTMPDSVLYCDIPYRGTNIYSKVKRTHEIDSSFYEIFYDWCRRQKELIIISEYGMPDDFVCVAEMNHTSTFSATANNKVKERIFVPRHQLSLYREMMNRNTLFGISPCP